jgi:hypothetical protein
MLLILATDVQLTSASVDHMHSPSFLLRPDLASRFLGRRSIQHQRHLLLANDVHAYFSCGPTPKGEEETYETEREEESYKPKEGFNSRLI